jgi:N-acetylglucosamine kinase-like BadF-type ATPase
MRYVLGIDAGGTKTVCLLAREDGEVVSEARAGGANLQAAGELEVEKVLHRVMDEAVGDRALRPDAICLGIAGVDRDEDSGTVRAIMRRISAKARTLVVNDALIALVAGAGESPGVVIIAGTGSIAYGRNAQGQAARAGGWGYVLGDEGSGYWIGRLALRAVVREADGRGPQTRLTHLILEHFGVTRAQGLIHEVYSRTLPPSAIARVARHVQSAANDGDAVAVQILTRAADELAVSATAVVSALRMQADTFPFVLAGGIFGAVPTLADALTTHLATLAPRAAVNHLAVEPAIGAVRLAMAELTGGARLPAYV